MNELLSILGLQFLSDQTFWTKTLECIASLSLLVFIHELGHYMWARFFGVRVTKFYLFFNPWVTLASWLPREKKFRFFYRNPSEEEENKEAKDKAAKDEASGSGNGADGVKADGGESQNAVSDDSANDEKATWRDTEYGLGWLPLGGYCAIAGMIDETQSAKDLSEKVHRWEFRSKSTWKRLMIMIGGVLNNFLLAIVIYAGMVWWWGEEYVPCQNASLGMEFSESARKIGFRDGDILLAADGNKLERLDSHDMLSVFNAHEVTVLRGSDTVTVNVPKNFIFEANKDAERGEIPVGFRMPAVVKGTMPGDGAEKAGLKEGDRMLAIDSAETTDFKRFTQQLALHKGKTVPITFVRGNDTITSSVTVSDAGKIGVMFKPIFETYKTEKIAYSLLGSIPRGISMGVTQLVDYAKSLKQIFSREGAQSLGGFGTIGSLFPETWSWYGFWSLTAFLSVILAFMNILPIPALDGGHVMFLLYEMIFRRKPSEKFLEKAQMVGMALLLALLLYANGNDIYRFLIKPLL